ncbi:MAG: hypothetical protein AAF699_10560 [Pseudomonadota bacterium]
MRATRILAIVLSALAVTSCKLRIVVPEGGTVRSQSGAYVCAAGQRCTIDVVDFFFNETFIAQPASGYTFTGWRKADRRLCGGDTGNCTLSTRGLDAVNSQLTNLMQSIFDSNSDVFFLQAVFEQTDGGGSGGGSAASCWNEELFLPGTQTETEYRVTETLGNEIITNYKGIVEGGLSFNGNATNALVLDIVSSGDVENTSLSRSYLSTVVARQVRDFGTEVEVTSPIMVSARTVNEPFRLIRFDLSPGQSFSQSYVTTTTTDAGGGAQLDSVSTDSVTTFDGIESVTVPAGSFQACRFTEISSTPGGEDTQREWIHVGTGVLLKAVNDAQTTELVAASVNGTGL